MATDKQKFPVGRFEKPEIVTTWILRQWIEVISDFPAAIRNETGHLTDAQLDTEYRPGGWTIRQVVHHCADSHLNSLIRFKLALTEENPIIRPYFEDRWAELPDSKLMPVNVSIKILEGLHARWVFLLNSFSETDFERTFIHPESKNTVSLAENIGIYAWHCRHHLAHITNIKNEKGWK